MVGGYLQRANVLRFAPLLLPWRSPLGTCDSRRPAYPRELMASPPYFQENLIFPLLDHHFCLLTSASKIRRVCLLGGIKITLGVVATRKSRKYNSTSHLSSIWVQEDTWKGDWSGCWEKRYEVFATQHYLWFFVSELSSFRITSDIQQQEYSVGFVSHTLCWGRKFIKPRKEKLQGHH